MSSPKIWFITGASTGFGRSMTEKVLKNGDIAIATLRKPEAIADLAAQYPADKLLVLKLDVSKPQDIVSAFATAEKKFGRIDVVFNNAGYGTVGEVESTDDQEARKIFEVNFWGATQVTLEAVRFFREVNRPAGGRILQVSSMVGISGIPGMGFYAASKHAFEGISDSLVAELDPEWNIKITLIEPGAFRTNGLNNAGKMPPHPAYTKPTLPTVIARQHLDAPHGADAGKAAEKIYRLAALQDPPLHFPLGKDGIAAIRAKLAVITADTDKYASWSEDLEAEQ